MRFVHTFVHEILGVIGPEEGERVLIDDPERGLWAALTTDPSRHCGDADQNRAIGTMMLRVFTGGGPIGSSAERLEQEIQAVRSERKPTQGTYLVVRREGEVPDWDDPNERETEDFIIRLNGAPKAEISVPLCSSAATRSASSSTRSRFPLQILWISSSVYPRITSSRVTLKVSEASFHPPTPRPRRSRS